MSTNQSASGQATTSSQPAQTTNVHVVQASNQKGNQQPRRNRKKGKNNNNKKGGYKNENANNNDKNNKNAGGDKKTKRKVKFPCKLCKDDHLTYLCPRMDEASKFIAQGPAVLKNPLPHNQNMNSKSHDHLVMIMIRRRLVVVGALTWFVPRNL